MNTDLRTVPGVGPSIEGDLVALGVHSIEELRGQDPDELYARLCAHQGERVDRCVLYVFRCAVYFAEAEEHDPELLKWWNWKDPPRQPQPESRGGASAPATPRGC